QAEDGIRHPLVTGVQTCALPIFLNGGRWQGKQIVSEAWVKESTKNRVGPGQIPDAAHATGYGYQWWLNSFRVGDRVVESLSARRSEERRVGKEERGGCWRGYGER